MQEDLICVKIKDGLYIGNKKPAEDIEFLLTNKFGFLLNCTAELPNHYENFEGVKYLRVKYERGGKAKLWGEAMKKLNKACKFIEEAEDIAQCCLVYSNLGNNRCCVIVIAYLMRRFLWTLDKALSYLNSKKVEMKLSSSYVQQLRLLQAKLQQQNALSNDWRRTHMSQEERVIVNTYINTAEIKYEQQPKQVKEGKKVMWKDRIEKALKKEEAMKKEQKGEVKEEKDGPQRKNSKKREPVQKVVKKPIKALNDDDSIVKLIKKKLKESRNVEDQSVTIEGRKQVTPIYNLTVNNFINPNINFFAKEQMKDRPASGDGRAKRPEPEDTENKISRVFSQKQHRSLQRDRQKATNMSASLMKSLITLQHEKGRQSDGRLNQYRSANGFERDDPLISPLTRLESPKPIIGKKMQKSMSFEGRKR